MRLFIYFFFINLIAIYFSQLTIASHNYQIEVNGIRVVGKGYSADFYDIRPLHSAKGISIGLSVTTLAGGIIEFDEDSSVIDKILDDKGNNLFTIGKGLNSTRFGFTPQISKDGKCVFLEIESPKIPAKGSHSINVSGIISLYTAYERKTYKSEGIIIEKGREIDIGPIFYIISEIKKPSYGKYPLQVTFQSKQKDNSVDSIKFYDETTGNEIKSILSASGQSGNQYNVIYERTYDLLKNVHNVKIDVTYWIDMKKCLIPFDIKTSIGF